MPLKRQFLIAPKRRGRLTYVRVPSRTMSHRTIQESTSVGQKAEVVVSEKMNRRGR